jgi:hypothetical protein
MSDLQSKITTAWQDAVNLVLGIWLAVSPFALAYADQATPAWNAHVVGIVIVVLAAAAIWAFQAWEEWINAVLGLWLIVSPWVLGFSGLEAPLWNQIVVGLAVGGLALWSAISERPAGGLAHKT